MCDERKSSVAAVRGDPALPPPYREKALLRVVTKAGVRRRVLDRKAQNDIKNRIMHARATFRLHHLLSQDPPFRRQPSFEDTDDDGSVNEGMENVSNDGFEVDSSLYSSQQGSLWLSTPPPSSLPVSSSPSLRSSSPVTSHHTTPPPKQLVLSVSPFKTVFKTKNPSDGEGSEHDDLPVKIERRRGRDRRVGADGHLAMAGLELVSEGSSGRQLRTRK
jgi:hypothetical protein